jgi:hypothetical protein
MYSFGEDLNVLNKDNFNNIFREKSLKKLRKCVYNFMLDRKGENDFFDIDTFNRRYVNNIDTTNDIINIVVNELNSLGWNTHIGFGFTGLYVYSSTDLPVGAY